jgi:hypothetical protein
VRVAGDYLKDKYDGATEVRVNKRGRLQIKDSRYNMPTANDLVYLSESPNYCVKNLVLGSMGKFPALWQYRRFASPSLIFLHHFMCVFAACTHSPRITHPSNVSRFSAKCLRAARWARLINIMSWFYYKYESVACGEISFQIRSSSSGIPGILSCLTCQRKRDVPRFAFWYGWILVDITGGKFSEMTLL